MEAVMDGSMFAFLAEHPAGVMFALAGAMAVGFAVYRHTANCKLARDKVYTKLDEVKNAVSELSSRISALEAMSNSNHLKEIAALVAGIKDKTE